MESRLKGPGEAPAPPVQVTAPEPLLLGVIPPSVALLLGVAATLGGVAEFGSGTGAGPALLAIGAALLALTVIACVRWPTSRVPRTARRLVAAVSYRLGAGRVSAAVWEKSRREARIKRKLRQLRERREREQAALGEAAYREQDEQMDSRREALASLDRKIEKLEDELVTVAEIAQMRVERERAAVPPTQPVAVPELQADPGHDGETRAIPTEERPAADADS